MLREEGEFLQNTISDTSHPQGFVRIHLPHDVSLLHFDTRDMQSGKQGTTSALSSFIFSVLVVFTCTTYSKIRAEVPDPLEYTARRL